MKIAFTTSGDGLGAPLDSRFGRAAKFLIYDLESDTFEVLDNQQNLNAAQGAGIQSAETVARSGAKELVTGHCGPKAFRVLTAAGIRVFNTEATTVAEALEWYRAGHLRGQRGGRGRALGRGQSLSPTPRRAGLSGGAGYAKRSAKSERSGTGRKPETRAIQLPGRATPGR